MGSQKLRFVIDARGILSMKDFSPEGTAVMGATPVPIVPCAVLVGLDSDNHEKSRYALRTPETLFGRSKGAYTFPEDHYMSTTHARMKLQNGQYFLEDLGSRNGTFMRIRKRALVGDRDTLMIGRKLLRVLAEELSPPSN